MSEALACLDRFTAAFNACDAAGMDAELHFPHKLLSGPEQIVWDRPRFHPPDLFAVLRAQGWVCTRYESREPLPCSEHKVHVRVVYTRRRTDGSELSRHDNLLWVVVQRDGRWGIIWRSY